MRMPAIVVIAALLVGFTTLLSCQRRDPGYFCRYDNRECFSSRSECTKPRRGQPEVRCFKSTEAYCFVLVGGWLAKPSGTNLCVPTVQECLTLQQDRYQSGTGLAIGACAKSLPKPAKTSTRTM